MVLRKTPVTQTYNQNKQKNESYPLRGVYPKKYRNCFATLDAISFDILDVFNNLSENSQAKGENGKSNKNL